VNSPYPAAYADGAAAIIVAAATTSAFKRIVPLLNKLGYLSKSSRMARNVG
jgi:hypothetical protein